MSQRNKQWVWFCVHVQFIHTMYTHLQGTLSSRLIGEVSETRILQELMPLIDAHLSF
jgi:hypothetical protein